MGGSAIAWINAASNFDSHSKVYCVDTWLGSAEHYLNVFDNEWKSDKLALTEYGPTFFDEFLFNVWNNGYQDRILPFRAPSSAALPLFTQKNIDFDVVYVDGAHDCFSVFHDVLGALKIINSNGLICGDDFRWGSVKAGLALVAIRRKQFLQIFTRNNDFILLPTENSLLKKQLRQKGYLQWNYSGYFLKYVFASLLFLGKS